MRALSRLASESALAFISAAALAVHLAARWLPRAPAAAREGPLVAAVIWGGTISVYRIGRRLLARDLGADLLAALAIATSVATRQWLVADILVLMLSGGGALERFASRRASSVLDTLARRMPQLAHRKTGDAVTDVAIGGVAPGDLLLVLPHELCPVDGVVMEGRGGMDESYLTGEPYELAKAPGSTVLSGAINGAGALTIRAGKRAADSRYASIMKVMRAEELSRPRLRRLGDQLAAWYIPLTLAAAVGAWLASGSVERFLAVLVVATPCPLLIAIPVAVIGAISLAARRGIVIKDPATLERITRCRTVILDKTGTLTFGKPSVTEVVALDGEDPREALRLAAGLERYSRHPLAAAVLARAAALGVTPASASAIAEEPGQGLSGQADGRAVRVTGRSRLGPAGATLPPAQEGLECVVVVDGEPSALLRFRDAPRPESRPFLRHLKPAHGVQRIMLVSGDRDSEVRYLAGVVGISEVFAEQSPESKLALVKRETERTQTLFVGDGINDAPALAAATVGVAMGQGSDVTSAAAGAVIMTPAIGKLDELIHIGGRMRSIALQSAIGGMALSLVAMAFAGFGRLPPVEGAVAQELIDLLAVLNAVRVSLPPRALRDFE